MQRTARLSCRRGSSLLLAVMFMATVGIVIIFGLTTVSWSTAVETRLAALAHQAAYAAASTATVTGGPSGKQPFIDSGVAQVTATELVNRSLRDSSLQLAPGSVAVEVRAFNVQLPTSEAIDTDPDCNNRQDAPGGSVTEVAPDNGFYYCWMTQTINARPNATGHYSTPVESADRHWTTGVQVVLRYRFNPCERLLPGFRNTAACRGVTYVLSGEGVADFTTQVTPTAR